MRLPARPYGGTSELPEEITKVRRGAARGSDTEWQARRIYQPGIPADATMLTVQTANVAKRIIGTMDLPLAS
jgi:hypothetical protein